MTNDENKGLNSVKEAVDQLLYVNSTISRKNRRKSDKQRDLFIQTITLIEYAQNRSIIAFNDLNISLEAYDDRFYDIIDHLIYLKYGKDCAEIISFYLWERINPDGTINTMIDENQNLIELKTPLDLWCLLTKIKPDIDK